VQEFVEKTFSLLGLDWREHVEVDPRYFRPTEVDVLQGDASKAREKLGWKPSMTFAQLVEIMVNEDLQLAREELAAARVRGR
jgi:GDPmannose 4,6-dehydratase